MGDTDESSSAAHGAQIEDDSTEGLFARWWRALGNASELDDNGSGADGAAPSKAQVLSLANLARLRVEDVMIPRVEIVATPVDIDKDDLLETFRDSGLSRLPVYQDTLDTPLGLVHLKDFALRHGFNGGQTAEFDLRSMLRPLLYAPPSMPIGVLLQKMQAERIHMALVIDEYGGVDGLLTIEDLIEQVLGEIEDEHDIAEGQLWAEEAPGCYLVQARTPVEDFEDLIGQKLVFGEDVEEIDTLGGLVFMLAGRVPARGEVVKHPEGIDFEVVDADPRRIKRLRVRIGASRREAAE
ncbi:MAG: hemolysin family protein [Silicimonas sp.]|jgi:magnesium and cobalt transporter|nr:hemolysin family protein [Silicimonas sp.]